MKYMDLIELTRNQGWFDMATLTQMTGERRESLQVQLYRWRRAGKLLPLRRGMYALPEIHCVRKISPLELANGMYAPSYLSRHWALGYYGLIPERVVEFTSTTSRAPKRFENAFGVFSYRHVKQTAFFGYRVMTINGACVFLAEPEKALLDLWYLEKGDWTMERMAAMRFQEFDRVNAEKLMNYAAAFQSTKVLAAARTWSALLNEKPEEGREI